MESHYYYITQTTEFSCQWCLSFNTYIHNLNTKSRSKAQKNFPKHSFYLNVSQHSHVLNSTVISYYLKKDFIPFSNYHLKVYLLFSHRYYTAIDQTNSANVLMFIPICLSANAVYTFLYDFQALLSHKTQEKCCLLQEPLLQSMIAVFNYSLLNVTTPKVSAVRIVLILLFITT